ncbi:nuclear transport factor 2 family protein [Novosphingobium sp. JCM 18896]|uniref:nuclear transport factor 2 family protein n=1 Tax=Novosphingobium sp. JCM 18896 TaxID=2989731 RepID=UPI00222157F6|nr:hypothetical protein [Novosphingobium sp. JCM 18896]MCW1430666.1 hypothetical protein [Novosphingobium sp. JCM 18896]
MVTTAGATTPHLRAIRPQSAYVCYLLTATFYFPKSHNIKFLRSLSESKQAKLIEAWSQFPLAASHSPRLRHRGASCRLCRPECYRRTSDGIETRNHAAVAQSFEAWRSGTGSPFDLLADDARWTIEGHSVASKTYPNKEAFLAEVIRPFNARMRVGLKPMVRSLHADGDTVIVLFDARGTARDGKPYVNSYAVPQSARRADHPRLGLFRRDRVQRLLVARLAGRMNKRPLLKIPPPHRWA